MTKYEITEAETAEFILMKEAYDEKKAGSERAKTVLYATRRMENQIVAADQTLAKWAEKLTTNPTYAFSWGQDAVDAAGEIEVLHEALRILGQSQDLEVVLKWLTDKVLSAGRFPSRSSSAMHNVTEEAKVKAAANLIDWVNAWAGR